MGKATVLKDLAALPPVGPMETLEDLVRDWKWRHPREKRDMVWEYCRTAPDLETAIRRAIASKDENGKHHNHQSKIASWAYEPFTKAVLGLAPDWKALPPSSFDALHDDVEEVAPAGIGPVFVYDASTRIGAYLDLHPSSVYLHAGVRIGAGLLGLNVRGRKRIPRSELPAAFKPLGADEVEDMLCGYRSLLAELGR